MTETVGRHLPAVSSTNDTTYLLAKLNVLEQQMRVLQSQATAGGNPIISYAPTIEEWTGCEGEGRYQVFGKVLHLWIKIRCSSPATGGGALAATLPSGVTSLTGLQQQTLACWASLNGGTTFGGTGVIYENASRVYPSLIEDFSGGQPAGNYACTTTAKPVSWTPGLSIIFMQGIVLVN